MPRTRRLSVVRAVAVGWARLGDKSLFRQWGANANRKRGGPAFTDCQYVAIAWIWVQAWPPLTPSFFSLDQANPGPFEKPTPCSPGRRVGCRKHIGSGEFATTRRRSQTIRATESELGPLPAIAI
jgi:hypothetical protein